MKHTHAQLLGTLITTIAVTSPLSAQVKFADFSSAPEAPSKSISYQEAKSKRDLKHGTLVSLNLSDGTKVTGHVVRFDPKSNQLFLRTRPGQLPVGYAEGDIMKIARATTTGGGVAGVAYSDGETWRDLPGGLQENTSGAVRIRPRAGNAIKAAPGGDGSQIRPAVDDGAGTYDNIVQPEIVKQVFYNGTQRTVVYHSTVVSPGEREILDQMEKAENDLAIVSHNREAQEAAVRMETAMQEERLRNQRLINDTLRNENIVNYPYPHITPANLFAPVGGQHKGVVTLLPQAMPAAPVAVAAAQPIDPVSLAKIRDDLALARPGRLRRRSTDRRGRQILADVFRPIKTGKSGNGQDVIRGRRTGWQPKPA